MSDLNNPEYYAARAVKALDLAASATDPEIVRIHRSMAASYAELAALTSEQRPMLKIVAS